MENCPFLWGKRIKYTFLKIIHSGKLLEYKDKKKLTYLDIKLRRILWFFAGYLELLTL